MTESDLAAELAEMRLTMQRARAAVAAVKESSALVVSGGCGCCGQNLAGPENFCPACGTRAMRPHKTTAFYRCRTNGAL